MQIYQKSVLGMEGKRYGKTHPRSGVRSAPYFEGTYLLRTSSGGYLLTSVALRGVLTNQNGLKSKKFRASREFPSKNLTFRKNRANFLEFEAFLSRIITYTG